MRNVGLVGSWPCLTDVRVPDSCDKIACASARVRTVGRRLGVLARAMLSSHGN